MWVLKVGGRQLDDPAFLDGLADLPKQFEQPPILVHGGGKGTSALSQRLGLESRFVDGLRVTDTATLEAAVMGLAGLAKMQVVQGLVRHGLKALGLTGADAGLVRCRKLAQKPTPDVLQSNQISHFRHGSGLVPKRLSQ